MPILCHFYVKMPLQNLYFFDRGLTPLPLLNNVKKIAELVKTDIPNSLHIWWPAYICIEFAFITRWSLMSWIVD